VERRIRIEEGAKKSEREGLNERLSTDGEDPTDGSERRKEKRRLNEGMKKTRA
jgi:hypothetical protein